MKRASNLTVHHSTHYKPNHRFLARSESAGWRGGAGCPTLVRADYLKQIQHLLVIDPDFTLRHLTNALRKKSDVRLGAGEHPSRAGAKGGNHELCFGLVEQEDPGALGRPFANILRTGS